MLAARTRLFPAWAWRRHKWAVVTVAVTAVVVLLMTAPGPHQRLHACHYGGRTAACR